MKNSIPTSCATILILLLLVLGDHSVFSQAYGHGGESSEISQLQSENSFRQRFNKNISNMRLHAERPLSTMVPMSEPYTLYGNDPSDSEDFYITFNLENKQMVQYELVNIEGKSIMRDEWPEVSNQTFRVESKAISSGLYIFRLMIGNKYYVNRVYLRH